MAVSKAPKRTLSSIIGVVIHHSGEEPASETLKSLKAKAKSFDNYHSFKDYDGNKTNDAQYTGGELGYKWILYHYLVGRDASVLPTQDIKYRRFHCGDSARGASSLNEHGIAICIDGNYSKFKLKTSQKIAVARIIYELEKRLKKTLIVRTHREQALLVSGGKVYYPEKTGKIYTECAGNTIGTHSSGSCKEIIALVSELHKNNGLTNAEKEAQKPPVTTPKPPIEPEKPTITETECAKRVSDAENAKAKEFASVIETLQKKIDSQALDLSSVYEELRKSNIASQAKEGHLQKFRTITGIADITAVEVKVQQLIDDEKARGQISSELSAKVQGVLDWFDNLFKKNK